MRLTLKRTNAYEGFEKEESGMRTRLRLIDKFRRPSWLQGRDRYYFVLRVADDPRDEPRIYERRVSRQCYYRFSLDEFLYSENPKSAK